MTFDISKIEQGDEVIVRGTFVHTASSGFIVGITSGGSFTVGSADIVSVTPRPPRAGDCVYARINEQNLSFLGGPFEVLAIADGIAWLRNEANRSRIEAPLSSLVRLPTAAPSPSERNP